MNRGLFGRKQTWGMKVRRTGNLKYRPLIVEPLETRRFMSAFSPVQPAALETEGAEIADLSDEMVSSSAIYAPQVPIAVSWEENVSQGSAAADLEKQDIVSEASLKKTGAEIPLLTVDGAEKLDGLASAESRLNSVASETANTLAQEIAGIPPGDAGGLAGGNGGGRLPLEIPGFGGYGNAYYLTDLTSMPRVIWLYAQYFGNQRRVVPETTDLPRSEDDISAGNSGLFGTSLGMPFSYSDLSGSDKNESEDGGEEKKDEAEGAPPVQDRKIERFIQEEMDRKFLDLLERKKFFEKQRSPMKYELQKPVFPENTPIPEDWPGESTPELRDEKPKPEQRIPEEMNFWNKSFFPNNEDWIDYFRGRGVPLRRDEEQITDAIFQSGNFGKEKGEENVPRKEITEVGNDDFFSRFSKSRKSFWKKSDSAFIPSQENRLERKPQDEMKFELPSRNLNLSPLASPSVRQISPEPETDTENQLQN